jgi:hypothetical protein
VKPAQQPSLIFLCTSQLYPFVSILIDGKAARYFGMLSQTVDHHAARNGDHRGGLHVQ